jgi:hypothetical protein
MQRMGLQGVTRGRTVRTTISDKAAPCDRGVQYASIKYTARLCEAGLVPSVGSVGDSYDQCARRNDQRALQSRSDRPARPLALAGSRRVRHARMGRLVQAS